MVAPHLRLHSAYVDDHPRDPTPVGGPSMTRQEFADECDINVLMARYEKAGGMLPVSGAEPRYLDLTGVPDFQAAMQLMIDADQAFMTLPAHVRRDFDNDPGKFVEFAEKPENLEQMREWKLAPPAPVEPPVPVVRVLADPPADTPPSGGDKAKK